MYAEEWEFVSFPFALETLYSYENFDWQFDRVESDDEVFFENELDNELVRGSGDKFFFEKELVRGRGGSRENELFVVESLFLVERLKMLSEALCPSLL